MLINDVVVVAWYIDIYIYVYDFMCVLKLFYSEKLSGTQKVFLSKTA